MHESPYNQTYIHIIDMIITLFLRVITVSFTYTIGIFTPKASMYSTFQPEINSLFSGKNIALGNSGKTDYHMSFLPEEILCYFNSRVIIMI